MYLVGRAEEFDEEREREKCATSTPALTAKCNVRMPKKTGEVQKLKMPEQ
jgi:hypothetical protein